MTIIEGHDAAIAGWVAERLGVGGFQAPFRAFGFADGDRLLAGSVLNDYYGEGANVEWTHYGPRLFTRTMARFLGDWCFGRLAVSRVTARTARSNQRAQIVLLKGGFAFESVQRRFFGPDKDDDALVYVLWPEAARERGWIQ